MKLFASGSLPVFTKEDSRNSVRNNKEIIVKLQRTLHTVHMLHPLMTIFKAAVASSSQKRLYEVIFKQ